MKRTFMALLKLYPLEYRALFADEMGGVFEDARRDRLSRGWGCYTLFLLVELAGLLRGAAIVRGLDWWQTRTLPTVVRFLAGAIVSVVTVLRPLMMLGNRTVHVRGDYQHNHSEMFELVVLATISVVLIAGFSVAFVLNLRSLVRQRSKS